MRRAFTLLEIVIVVLIIWILFWAIWFLSWSYIYRLNIQNDQETVINTFRKVQTMSLSQPVYKNTVLPYIGIKLIPKKTYLLEIWSTWNMQNYFSLQAQPLYYLTMWSGFDLYSWDSKIFLLGSWEIFYKSYWLGAYFLHNWVVYSGNKIVKFVFSDKIWREKRCFKVNLASGRIFIEQCK